MLLQLNNNFLHSVRVCGTENRLADIPVAAKDEVFELIVFYGQNIKDIRLCEPSKPQPTMPGTLPYDPAIIQVCCKKKTFKIILDMQHDGKLYLVAVLCPRSWSD